MPDEQYSKEILDVAKRLYMNPSYVAEIRTLPIEELRETAAAYLRETHQSPAYWKLMPAKDMVVPELIAAFDLDEPFKANDDSGLEESPATRALDFLPKGRHEELKKHLLHWLKVGDAKILRKIGGHLLAYGSDDILHDVVMLFEHEDIYVASAARRGAMDAIKAGRLEPGLRSYVWKNAVALLDTSTRDSFTGPVQMLLALNEDEAAKVLLGPDVMRLGHPHLTESLKALNRLHRPPNSTFLNAILNDDSDLRPRLKAKLHEAAIQGLIINQDPTAEKYVEEIIAHPNDYDPAMILAAWIARLKLKGLKSILESADESYEAADLNLETLSLEERYIVLSQNLDANVRNGGFGQWYENSMGIHAVETQKALSKVGAKKHARIVGQANRLFGKAGPPETHELIEKALDAMSPSDDEKMDKLNDSWYRLPTWEISAAEWDWKRQTEG